MREWVTKSLPTCFKKLAAQFKALQNDNHLNTIKEQVRKKISSNDIFKILLKRLHHHKTPFFSSYQNQLERTNAAELQQDCTLFENHQKCLISIFTQKFKYLCLENERWKMRLFGRFSNIMLTCSFCNVLIFDHWLHNSSHTWI